MQLEIKEKIVQIVYEKFADISTIFQQKKIFIEAIQASKPIEIEIKQLKVIDLESLQLLVCFKKTAEKKQLTLSLKSPSTEFIKLSTLLGFNEVFGVGA